MKKKLIAITMAAFMAATSLTACGGDTKTSSSAPSSSEPSSSAASDDAAEPATEDTAEDAADDMVSDETFAIIQENYAVMVQYHDAVAEAYNSDEIAANPAIEEAMNQAADVIVQMGEIEQGMLTEEKAVELNDLILGIVDGLTEVVDAMEPAEGAAGEEGTPVSDETFGILQENWSKLTDFYNEVATSYNNGEIEQNEDFEKLMNQAADILEEIQNISRDDLTEEKAVEVNEAMLLVLEGLGQALGLEE